MDTTTPANPTQPSALNPLPQSPRTQIFIHPEHELGNLIKSLGSNKTFSISLRPVFLSVFFVVFGVALSVLVFIFLPATRVVSYASSTKEIVTKSSEKADKVNSSLDIFYKARTAQVDGNVTQIKDQTVLGVLSDNSDTSAKTNIFKTSQTILETIKQSVSKQNKVKGFAVPADDPTKEVRNHRDLATDIGVTVAAEKEINDQLLDLETHNIPSSANELKSSIHKLGNKTSEYLIQAQKTSNYYIEVSDASIELINLASGLVNLSSVSKKSLEDDISRLTALKSKFAGFGKKQLPEKIEPYNQNLVSVFSLLTSYFTVIRDQFDNPKPTLEAELAQYSTQLQTISHHSVANEIGFWQGNTSLSRFDDLSREHIEVLQLSRKVHDKNYFFFLDWLGVS